MSPSDRNAALAAFLILVTVGLGFFFAPAVVVSLSAISPWLSAFVAIVFVAAFFVIFWLRARSQRQRDGQDAVRETDGAVPLIAAGIVLVWFVGLLLVPDLVASIAPEGGARTALVVAYLLLIFPGLWLLTRVGRRD